MFVMNKRINNLQFSFSDDRFPEIVAWNTSSNSDTEYCYTNEYCYTLARWEKYSEGYELKFIGSRPFKGEDIDSNLFWELAKYGQRVIDAVYDLEYYTNNL